MKRLTLAVCLLFTAVISRAAQINTFGRLEIKADDGSFTARVTGRVHMDANFYDSSSEDKKLVSGAFIRRARIGVEGNFHAWEYEVEFDAASDQSKLMSAKLRRWVGPGKWTLGQFKIFEGLEMMTSSNHITFIERSYVSEMMPSFKIGTGYNGTIKRVGFSGNIYNLREAADGEDRPTTDGYGLVARGYITPINENMLVVHLGASYAYENTDSTGSRIRISPAGRAEEYKNGEEFRFVMFDRRDEDAQIHRVNLEALAINGPLSIEGEYLMGSAKTATRTGDDFTAWYGQVSYLLTGEARKYDFRRGRPEEVTPNRAAGALEVAARFQQAERKNVDNALLRAADFGLTYYANINVRFMVNYTAASNKLNDDNPRLISTRAQFSF